MSKTLHLSRRLALPIRAVTEKIGILGATGSGKTTTASVLVEELLKQQLPVAIIDPTDAWWGLRSSKDGKAEGYPVTVLGGDHGDVPLEETAGIVIADLIAESAPPLIISLANFTKGAMRRFMTDFAERLYLKNRRALHLVLDETDELAPQDRMKMKGGGERLYGAVDQIVRRGRLRGLGVTMISQRSAEISKSILSQCSILIAHRASHPTDLEPILDWMKHNARDRTKEVSGSISSLADGEAWVMSSLLKVFERYQIRDRETFNSSATPEPGEEAIIPKRLAKPDLALLQEKMRDTIERAQANDPAALRRQVADLQRELAKKPAAAPAPAKERRIEVPVLKDGQVKRLERLVELLMKGSAALSLQGQAIREVLERAAARPGTLPPSAPRLAPPIPRERPLVLTARPLTKIDMRPGAICQVGDASVGNSGLRRMLIALAQRPQGLTNQQLGVRAGVSSRSGTFSTYLGRARTQGWIEGRGHLTITHAGLEALGSYQLLPEGRALAEYWISQLGGGAARMLQVLVEAYPRKLTNAELGEAAQISAASGTFSTYLGRLRTLELVTGRGELAASEELAA